ncbi:hypothetical protein BZA70DRAFT_271130 [Myxozyma melibiosi]|uniref:Uncharacterized protein n=1 Tax=Myxozyma melibiosi TaxID=54550 RepID=A0ABR1FBZ6_9ASCO
MFKLKKSSKKEKAAPAPAAPAPVPAKKTPAPAAPPPRAAPPPVAAVPPPAPPPTQAPAPTPAPVKTAPPTQPPPPTTADAADEDGAKPAEILIEAARRNNVDLLQEVLGIGADGSARPAATDLINKSVDALGNTALHVAALNGSYECLDAMLDVEGVEVDPRNRMEGNTPLHCAVIYSEEEPEHAIAIVDMLIDAGCDPRSVISIIA